MIHDPDARFGLFFLSWLVLVFDTLVNIKVAVGTGDEVLFW